MIAPTVLAMGSRRELFVDDYLIDRLDGASLRLHEPRDEGISLQLDKPWEAPYPAYFSIVKDGDLYRMWYRGRYEASGGGGPSASVCYAESNDGIEWTRPNLGLFEVRGAKENNVFIHPLEYGTFSAFLDTRPGVPSSERLKALWRGPASFSLVSEDGIRWRNVGKSPSLRRPGPAWDTQNVAFWSESEQRYVAYVRTWKPMATTQGESRKEFLRKYGSEGHGWRWTGRTTSTDFVNWTDVVDMDFGDTPNEQLYTNGTHPYFRAPHIYIALAKRFMPGRRALPKEEAEALAAEPEHAMDTSDSVLMTSRGDNRYDRTFMEAFIRPGPSPRDWVARDNTPAVGVVPGGSRQMFLYRLSHYGQQTCHLTRYSLRLDGFVSVNAPYSGGEILTRPFTFTGSELEVNYGTSAAGGLRVEVQDANGRQISGYGLEDCPEFFGDEIARVVTWKNGTNTSQLQGRPIRLRIVLKDADLYSLRFRDPASD